MPQQEVKGLGPVLREIPGIYEAPGPWGTVVGLSGAAVFFIFVLMGDAERGKVAAFSLIALLAAAGFGWDYKGYSWFWAVLGVAFVAHLAMIFLIEWPPERGPAMKFAPFVLLDSLVLTLLIHGIAKLTKI